MFARILTIIKNLDWWLMLSVFVLIFIGLAELYSIGSGSNVILFQKQLIVALGGLASVLVLIFLDYYIFHSYSHYFYLLAMFLLILVLFMGSEINATKGWLKFGGLTLQPVEFAKVALIVALSKYFSGANMAARPWKTILTSGLILAGLAGPVFLQPDFGSALVLCGIWVLMLLFAGLPKKMIFGFILAGILASLAVWPFLADYQHKRVLNILRPQGGLTGDYNVNQAMIAIGSGNLFGRGLGFGSQSQLRFLPEAKNDFIFAVISEELGLVGVSLVLLAFAIIFQRILSNLANIKNNFGIFFCLGFMGLIFLQMFVNIGMNLGLLPVVGITLPFLSYGGSSLAANLMLVGITQSILVRSKIKNY